MRDSDKVQAYRNENGRLRLDAELHVGRSPREIATADFNKDGIPDFVVSNRNSYDVTVIQGALGAATIGFKAPEQVYPVDGEVSGLDLRDMNKDGKDDVVQIHRASQEISIRLAETNGRLGNAMIYATSGRPNAMDFADFNRDGHLDIVTAHLSDGNVPGTLAVRYGSATGLLDVARQLPTPLGLAADDTGSFYSVRSADFDGDGKTDVTAGYGGRQLYFWKGVGDGTFTPVALAADGGEFLYQGVELAVGDFDADGDLDLAGAGFYGQLCVIENTGHLLEPVTRSIWCIQDVAARLDRYRAKALRVRDMNGDGQPDLLLGMDFGVAVYLHAGPAVTPEIVNGITTEDDPYPGMPVPPPGLSFFRWLTIPGAGVSPQPTLPHADVPLGGLVFGDFDNNGSDDIASSCLGDGCLTVLKKTATGEYSPAVRSKVPSSEYIATGDLDGDGEPDLVGSGRTALWVAVSGAAAQAGLSRPLEASRPAANHVVINELMASNQSVLTGLPSAVLDPGTFPDWIELANPGPYQSLVNWKLRLTRQDGTTVEGIVGGFNLASKGHVILPCAGPVSRSLYHTGFELPSEGGKLTLYNAEGRMVDEVNYPEQLSNQSYSRYADGSPAFSFNRMPDPGAGNIYNGPAAPQAAFGGLEISTLGAGRPLRFFAHAHDDAAMLGARIIWRRIDSTGGADPAVRSPILLFDDGRHGDGRARDGMFAGDLTSGLPAGAEIEFYLEATDVNGLTVFLPAEPKANDEDDEQNDLFRFAMTDVRPGLEISEIVTANTKSYKDEGGSSPDYVEVRNVTDGTIDLTDVRLTKKPFDGNAGLHFPPGYILQPGEHIVISCDENSEQGPLHAPFKLESAHDEVWLAGVSAGGSVSILDGLRVAGLLPDQALQRLGADGAWATGGPTAGRQNTSAPIEIYSVNGAVTVIFPTLTGHTCRLQASDTLGGSWVPLLTCPGNGVERAHIEAIGTRRFYRMQE